MVAVVAVPITLAPVFAYLTNEQNLRHDITTIDIMRNITSIPMLVRLPGAVIQMIVVDEIYVYAIPVFLLVYN